MVRIIVTLSNDEASGVNRKSGEELRDPREQIRFWVREKLNEAGLLPAGESVRQVREAEREQQAA